MMLRISGSSSSSMVTTLGKSVSLVTLRSIMRIGSKVQFSQCKKRRLHHHHHQQRSRVLVCRVVATATAAAQGEETFTVKQKGTTVQGLPPAPSEASLTTVANCLSLSLSLSLWLTICGILTRFLCTNCCSNWLCEGRLTSLL
jgi:hypothetical protein